MLPIDDIGAFDTVIRHPQLYRPEQSERERHRRYQLKNPPIKLKDPFNYIDVAQPVFPFFIDAKQIVFMGRINEEPVSATFTIANPAHRSFWYKIKTSSREMFKVSKPCGRLERGEQVTIPVIFYPNQGCPKPFTQYLNVYALYDDSKIDTCYEAFSVEERLRPLKKRLYAEFIWHPNIAIAQAYENGKILEMTKSHNTHMNEAIYLELRKEVYNKYKTKQNQRAKDGKRKKQKSEAIHFVETQNYYKYPLSDATEWHRQRQIDQLAILHRNAINKMDRTSGPDTEAILQNTIANKNLSRVACLLGNPKEKKPISYQPLHARSEYLDDFADVLWNDFRKELGTKSKTEYYQHFDDKKKTKLLHTTPEEREMNAMLKEQAAEKKKADAEKEEKEEKEKKKREEAKQKAIDMIEEYEKKILEKEKKKNGSKVKAEKPVEEKKVGRKDESKDATKIKMEPEKKKK